MRPDRDRLRIVIAVTESCPLRQLWKAAMRHVDNSQAELVTLYVSDERWQRAASLPFTCEISRVSGSVADFTRRRAEQLVRDAVSRTRRRIKKLASETDFAFVFRVWSESDSNQIKKLVGDGQVVLVAPSSLTSQPVYASFEKLDWRIVLIETTGENNDSQ